MKFESHPTRAVVHHFDHLAFPGSKLFNDAAQKRFRAIDDEHLERLMQLSTNGLGENFRLPDHQLVSLAAYRFDESRQLQLTAARHRKRCCTSGFLSSMRNIR